MAGADRGGARADSRHGAGAQRPKPAAFDRQTPPPRRPESTPAIASRSGRLQRLCGRCLPGWRRLAAAGGSASPQGACWLVAGAGGQRSVHCRTSCANRSFDPPHLPSRRRVSPPLRPQGLFRHAVCAQSKSNGRGRPAEPKKRKKKPKKKLTKFGVPNPTMSPGFFFF